MKVLVAGPWVGEFGWELMGWHSCLRSLASDYEIIILASLHSKYLYEDFCSQYVPVEKNEITNDYSDGYLYKDFNLNDLKKNVESKLIKNKITLNNNCLWLPPTKLIQTPGSTYHKFDQEFLFNRQIYVPKYKALGNEKKANRYVFHARGRKDVRPDNNWCMNNWKKLKDLLKSSNSQAKFYSIGTKKDSFLIEGTEDWRGKDLKSICELMNSSNAVFGPSSGAMHLASQCNAKVVVWSIEYNKKRYMNWWNPHQTPTLYLQKFNWHPTADYVYSRFKEWDMKEIKSDV
jgi:hypothetical protein